MPINPEKLNEFLGRALVDFGATFHAALVGIGDKLGLTRPSPPADRKRRRSLPNARTQRSATFVNG
jgi:hypothetical protein